MDAVAIPLPCGRVAFVDFESFESELTCHFRDGAVWVGRICDSSWYSNANRRTRYVVHSWGNRKVKLHRAVMCAPAALFVDHRDGNGLNNTRCNLRLATNRLNQANARLRSDNTSGFRGVAARGNGTFEASIRTVVGSKRLGTFATAEAAAMAYDIAALEIHGEFARLNFPLTSVA